MLSVDNSVQKPGRERLRAGKRPVKAFAALSLCAALLLWGQQAAYAEAPSLAPIQLAQAPPQFIPTDVTPFTINPERNNFSPGYKFKLFQALPERLYFNLSAETSQRLDTNVLFTANNPKADYVFRVLPNITVGYNIAKNTSVYVNYFVIKDTFASHGFLNAPTTQSLSWGVQHNKRLGDKTTLQYNVQARELWQAQGLHQFDFIPGVTLIHSITPRSVVYASTLLQMARGEVFRGANS